MPNVELEDLVLVRSDGRPTYNFASPLEDLWDGITHVIRGPDHISNTPKQINLLRTRRRLPARLRARAERHGRGRAKLSKRHGAVSVGDFRREGYVPEALVDFLALLGWAPDGETTVMSRDELVERFSLERVGSSPATFDYAKLDWMNGLYLRALPPDEYADRLVAYLREQGSDWPEERVRAAAAIVREKIGRLDEFAGFAGFLFHPGRTGSGVAGRAHPRCGRGGARANGAVGDGRDRGVAQEALRRPGGEAAHGVRPDPGRSDGLPRLARPVREPRAARQGRVPRAPARRRRGERVTALRDLVGAELGPTSWINVPQERIDTFARGDRRPAVDPRRRRARGRRPVRDDDRARLPHALARVPMLYELFPPSESAALVNYGVNRVRFPAPVPSGSRVRGRFRVLSVEDGPGGRRGTIEATVECDGVDKPVCVAELVVLELA